MILLLAVLGQGLDLASYGASLATTEFREANPAVLALGVWAIPAKLALVGFLVVIGVKLGQDWRVRVALCLATASGVVGAASNLNILHP